MLVFEEFTTFTPFWRFFHRFYPFSRLACSVLIISLFFFFWVFVDHFAGCFSLFFAFVFLPILTVFLGSSVFDIYVIREVHLFRNMNYAWLFVWVAEGDARKALLALSFSKNLRCLPHFCVFLSSCLCPIFANTLFSFDYFPLFFKFGRSSFTIIFACFFRLPIFVLLLTVFPRFRPFLCFFRRFFPFFVTVLLNFDYFPQKKRVLVDQFFRLFRHFFRFRFFYNSWRFSLGFVLFFWYFSHSRGVC